MWPVFEWKADLAITGISADQEEGVLFQFPYYENKNRASWIESWFKVI